MKSLTAPALVSTLRVEPRPWYLPKWLVTLNGLRVDSQSKGPEWYVGLERALKEESERSWHDRNAQSHFQPAVAVSNFFQWHETISCIQNKKVTSSREVKCVWIRLAQQRGPSCRCGEATSPTGTLCIWRLLQLHCHLFHSLISTTDEKTPWLCGTHLFSVEVFVLWQKRFGCAQILIQGLLQRRHRKPRQRLLQVEHAPGDPGCLRHQALDRQHTVLPSFCVLSRLKTSKHRHDTRKEPCLYDKTNRFLLLKSRDFSTKFCIAMVVGQFLRPSAGTMIVTEMKVWAPKLWLITCRGWLCLKGVQHPTEGSGTWGQPSEEHHIETFLFVRKTQGVPMHCSSSLVFFSFPIYIFFLGGERTSLVQPDHPIQNLPGWDGFPSKNVRLPSLS